ncbi:peptidylprolyl isomerase [Actinomadura craniellae]|uniref:Peptidylprolyl isomerase n=1 Tax=Actinomadura craniellae TaxID=2231787 RepID=A0A365HDP0_9ACTN|nr:peptidylprolyl isomerase [Actinomadura craniellae]RAY17221.1 peptidylprolyl isomerase [Actinomadura craniellae]
MAGKDRKKQLARQRYERQQQRRQAQEARARRMKIIGAGVAVVAVAGGGAAIVAVTGGGDEQKVAADQPTPTPRPTAKPGECLYLPDGSGTKKVENPPVKPAYKGKVKVTVETNLGDISMELDGKKAPCTVNSFTHLAKKNFFDKTNCHRLTTEGIKVLQCGDPSGSGSGGPPYRFPNEGTGDPQKMKKYGKATVAMAHSQQPDSNSSQFFMVYGDSQLPDDYTIFGKILSGTDILEQVAGAGSEPKGDGAPKKKVTIQDVTVARK